MAHLFSIQFDYQGISHNALVNVRTTPFFTEYHLGMLNEDVLNQLLTTVFIIRSGIFHC